MFCPNCGNNCGEANFCFNCGQNLRSVKQNHDDDFYEISQLLDLEEAAESPLGTDEVLQNHEIDEFIDELNATILADSEQEKAVAEYLDDKMRQSEEARCPRCKSTSIALSERRNQTNYPRTYRSGIDAAVAGLITTLISTTMDAKFEAKYGRECVCLKCGHTWYPKVQNKKQSNER